MPGVPPDSRKVRVWVVAVTNETISVPDKVLEKGCGSGRGCLIVVVSAGAFNVVVIEIDRRPGMKGREQLMVSFWL